MKLPKFNFNDSYPLTLGVADDYFTLSTRLKRLARAPMQPRRRAAWLLGGALCVSFVTVVPFRLTARAQTEAKIAKSTVGLIHGVVTYRGSTVPLAGQTIQLRDSKGQLTQTQTNAEGKFLLRANAGEAMLWIQKGDDVVSADAFKGKLTFTNTQSETYGESAEGFFHLAMTMENLKLTFTPANHRDSPKDREIEVPNLVFLPVKANAKREIEIETSIKPATIGATGALTGTVSLPNGQKVGVSVSAQPATAPDYKHIVQTMADAKGRYSIEGLQPGSYKISIGLDDKLAKEWAAPMTSRKSVVAGANRADFRLTRGALISGVVISKASRKPVPNIEVLAADKNGIGNLVKTDASGKFRLRVTPGSVAVRLRGLGSNLKLPGLQLPAQSESKFSLKEGDKRQVQFELPAKSKTKTLAVKAVTGTVIGPDGKPAAGAAIEIRDVSSASYISWRGAVRSDANGRFTIPPKLVGGGVSLRATASNLDGMTARALIATAGDNVTLKLQRDVAASVEGQVVDKITKQPIVGVKVWAHSPVTESPQELRTQQTDAQGRFRFEKLRPFDVSFFQFSKRGYQEDGAGTFVLQPGETKQLTVWMHPLSQTLSGRVTLAGGRAAGTGLIVNAANQTTKTKADGSFFLPAVLDEKLMVSVVSPAKKKVWGPFWTRGGRKNVQFGLTNARLQSRTESNNAVLERSLRGSQAKLVGQTAPPLHARNWIVGEAPTFQGRVTLLHFVWMNKHSSALNDLARSFSGRGVQVVTVEQLRMFWDNDGQPNREQYLIKRAREMGFLFPTTVAIDAPMAKRNGPLWLTGQSHQTYRGARYVIIGRDSRIKWVGNNGGRAIAKTIELMG